MGFFFDDLAEVPKRKSVVLKRLPPVPDLGWRPPTEFPNLAAAKMIGLDTETFEPDFDFGPGWARGRGHIVGYSLSADDGYGNVGKWYFPMRHSVEPEYNLNPEHCLAYAKHVLENPNVPKVGANLKYDMGWFAEEGVFIQGELHDVQYAETLITYDGRVALGHLAAKYLGEAKNSDRMYQWLAEAYGGSANDKQRANIHRCSPRLAGPYGESDADLPLRILRSQLPQISALELDTVYRMECDLITLLVRMRRAGVTVDLNRAARLYATLGLDLQRLQQILWHDVGFEMSVNSNADIAKAFDKFGLSYKLTKDDNPSFTKDFLKSVPHPLGDQIIEIRMIEKVRNTFLKAYILERHVNGKVYCSFNALKGEDGGAGTGRFSSSDPNFQNVPIRPGYTEEKLLKKGGQFYDPTYVAIGKRVRQCFIPDAGHLCWEKQDLSQIQYRYLAHYAVGPGSDRLRETYCNDPETDYHDVTHDTVLANTGVDIERRPIKNINFGLIFGMGVKKMGRQLGMEQKKTKLTFDAYHAGAPYAKATMQHFIEEAGRTGMVRTVLGRIGRFDTWEPRREIGDNPEDRKIALPLDRALQMYGNNIQRAGLYKALCVVLQGSEGDHMKMAMWRCMKEGVYDYIGVPRLTVHDELGYSVIDDSPQRNEAHAYAARLLENSIPLRIPVFVEPGRGDTWGDSE